MRSRLPGKTPILSLRAPASEAEPHAPNAHQTDGPGAIAPGRSALNNPDDWRRFRTCDCMAEIRLAETWELKSDAEIMKIPFDPDRPSRY
jgi:hypothetical protein